MLPFFVGKREVAALAISFQRWWQDDFPEMGRSMPPERRMGAAYYYAECRRLNGLYRGVLTTTGTVVEIDRGIAGPGSV